MKSGPFRRAGGRRLAAALGLALLVAGCGSAGQYGHSRVYSPLPAEEAAAEGSERYDPVMVRRLPQEWQQKNIDVFGVVLARAEGRDGLTDLTLSVRRLAALCAGVTE